MFTKPKYRKSSNIKNLYISFQQRYTCQYFVRMIHKNLVTRRLLLRPVADDDLNFIYTGLSHPEVIRFYGVRYDSIDATKTQMEWYKKIKADKAGIWWVISDHNSKTQYGAIGLNTIHPTHRKAEIGFWLLPPYWGSGYILEAAQVVCQFRFEQFNLHRIEAFVETGNRNSFRALEKLNFKHEGTMHECELKDDQWISLDVFARIKERR